MVDGRVLYTSVSSVSKFDPSQYGGCNRRWYIDKVMGIKEPQQFSQQQGTEVHAQIEHFLKTGEDVLGQFARSGKHFLPKPGTVEVERSFGLLGGKLDPAAVLKAADVPLIGYIDAVNWSGEYLDTEGAPRVTDVVEMIDWKTSSSIENYGKTAEDLKSSIQMVGYGVYGIRSRPGTAGALLSHVTFQTKGPRVAKKTTAFMSASELTSEWSRVDGVVERMKSVAGLKVLSDVEPNWEACNAWRGCPYKSHCPRSVEQTLLETFGGDAMSLSDLINKQNQALAAVNGAPAAPPALPMVPVAAPVAAAPAPDLAARRAEIAAELAKLEAAERAAAPPPAPPAPAPVPTAAPSGLEWLTGPIVQFLHPDTPPGAAFQVTPAEAAAARAKWEAYKAASAPKAPVTVVTAPVTPWVPPAPVQRTGPAIPMAAVGTAVPLATVVPPDVATDVPKAVPVPPEALATMPPSIQAAQAAMFAAAGVPVATLAPPAPEAKRGRGRPPKDGSAARPSAPAPAVMNPQNPASAVGTLAAAQAEAQAALDNLADSDGITLYVDCVVESGGVSILRTLDEYIEGLCRALCEQYHAADVRCAPADSPLGFGKWKGALAALAAGHPPAPGAYVVHVRGSEIKAVVVDALRGKAALVVTGIAS